MHIFAEVLFVFNKLLKVNKNYLDGSKEVILGLRCENISLDPTEETKDNGVDVYVSHFEELGNETLIYAELLSDDHKSKPTKVIIKGTSGSCAQVPCVGRSGGRQFLCGTQFCGVQRRFVRIYS